MIHHWLGWISLAFCVLLLAKYLGRISKNTRFNLALRRLHKPLGLAVIAVSALHGIICFFKKPQFSLPAITGLALFALILALARTFYARKKLKAKWFPMHRHLSALLCAVTALHILISIS